MNKIIYILLLFHSSFLFAFDDAFQTASSADAGGGFGSESERLLANAPASLCELEGMTQAECGVMSLLLGGNNFQRWALPAINKDQNFFKYLSPAQVDQVIRSYHINPTVDWLVPTAGQLQYLFNQKKITPTRNQSFWVRDAATGALNKMRYSPTDEVIPTTASLLRLADVSLTSDPVTDLTDDELKWIMFRNNMTGTTALANIVYRDITGRLIRPAPVRVEYLKTSRLSFPLFATDIKVEYICQSPYTSVCTDKNRPIDIKHNFHVGACVRIDGFMLSPPSPSLSYTDAATCRGAGWE